jgi:hypothetical protein
MFAEREDSTPGVEPLLAQDTRLLAHSPNGSAWEYGQRAAARVSRDDFFFAGGGHSNRIYACLLARENLTFAPSPLAAPSSGYYIPT